FFFQAEDGIRDRNVTGVQTCALPIYTLPSDEREYAQSDPWQLQQIMLNSGEDRSDIRNTFQYLARPETFEPIPSAGKKKQIRDGLAYLIGRPTGDSPAELDRDLLDIRRSLAKEIDGTFDFWTDGI